jgi:hypothetical protein
MRSSRGDSQVSRVSTKKAGKAPVNQKAAAIQLAPHVFGHQAVGHLVQTNHQQVGQQQGEHAQAAAGDVVVAQKVAEAKQKAAEQHQQKEQGLPQRPEERLEPFVERDKKIVQASDGQLGVEEAFEQLLAAAGRGAGGQFGFDLVVHFGVGRLQESCRLSTRR